MIVKVRNEPYELQNEVTAIEEIKAEVEAQLAVTIADINEQIASIEQTIQNAKKDIIDTIYPVGTVHMRRYDYAGKNPNGLFGGSWSMRNDNMMHFATQSGHVDFKENDCKGYGVCKRRKSWRTIFRDRVSYQFWHRDA